MVPSIPDIVVLSLTIITQPEVTLPKVLYTDNTNPLRLSAEAGRARNIISQTCLLED